jgi:peptidoglycan/xylan/chitin deacetylase (PgdA/CDA1 family)
MNGRPAVLLYHAVVNPPAGAASEEADLMVPPTRFAWQMADLASRGFRSLTLDQYWSVLEGQRALSDRDVLLTFDDAYAHVDETVMPTLLKHGFSAVMFVAYGHLGEHNTWDPGLRNLAMLPIAPPDQIRSMSLGPWEIASHGLRHVDLVSLPASECQRELAESRGRVSELAGKPVRDLAYPFGSQNAAVRAAARAAGYRMAFTAGRTSLPDRFGLDRLPIRGSDSPMVFRLKTSGWAGFLYGIADRSPSWARSAARRLTASATAARS